MTGEKNPTADLSTIVSAGAIVYALASVLHEGLGHAGACLLSGARPLLVSTVAMECSADTPLVQAGGTLVNAIAGALFLLLARATPRSRPILKFFLWLSMAVNFMDAAGYFLFSGVGGIGDWAAFTAHYRPQWAWRAGMAVFGGIAYYLAIRLSLHEMAPFIGRGPERVRRAARLALPPYLAGGILSCIAGALNPEGLILVASSAAAATFGGTSGLAWMHNLLRRPAPAPPAATETPPLTIPRSVPWIVAAAVVAAIFIGYIGPGVRFRH